MFFFWEGRGGEEWGRGEIYLSPSFGERGRGIREEKQRKKRRREGEDGKKKKKQKKRRKKKREK